MRYNLIVLSVIVALLCITLVNAGEDDTYEQNSVFDLKLPCINNGTYCSTNAICNLSVQYPNGTLLVNNGRMTNNFAFHNYTIPDTSIIGIYKYLQVCTDGDLSGSYADTYEITGNGNPSPTGATISLFTIVFILILASITYIIIYSIGHAIKLDFDIIDLAWNYGIYFAFVGFYVLSKVYLGEPMVMNIMSWIVKIGIVTSVVLPTIYFILTLTIGSWMQRRVKGVDY